MPLVKLDAHSYNDTTFSLPDLTEMSCPFNNYMLHRQHLIFDIKAFLCNEILQNAVVLIRVANRVAVDFLECF